MSEWEKMPLDELVQFQKGRKVETGTYGRANYAPYLGAGALTGKTDGYASTFMAVMAAPSDVLMLWDGERSGLVGYNLSGVVSSTVSKLSPTTKIDTAYLYYYLLLNFEWIQNRRTGTGVPHVPKDLGRILKINFPTDLPTQRKIARILQTIDRAMERTEALIGKYQQIKAGLMHDLFTRGLWTREELDRGDHLRTAKEAGLPAVASAKAGQLRPTRQQAPQLYKETAIGWIPKAWSSQILEDLLAPVSNNLRSGPFGSALLKSELVENGIPFLGIDNIHVEEFVRVFSRFVSEKKFRDLFKYSVRPKDVVITIMGTVGRSAIIPNDMEPALSSKHLWTMTFDQDKVFPELVCWQLNFASWVKYWFRKETQGGIMDAIQSKTLRTLKLPVPPINEQEEIKQRYDAISLKLELESLRLTKLQKQKFGLMHDLLTGKVKVQPEGNDA